MNCDLLYLGYDVANKLQEHGWNRGEERKDGDGGRGQAYVPVPEFPTGQTQFLIYLKLPEYIMTKQQKARKW